MERATIDTSQRRLKRALFLALSAAACLAFYIFLLRAFWPGLYNVDSNYQWDQVSGHYPYDDLHPLFFGVLMMPWARTGSSIWGFVLTQMVVVIAVMTWALKALMEAGVAMRKAWLVPAAYILLPMIPLHALTVYKDVYYSVAIVGITAIFIRTNAHDREWSTGDRIIFIASAVAAALLRYNGPPVAALCVAAAVLSGKFPLRVRLLMAAAYLALSMGISAGLTSIFHPYHRNAAEVVLPHHLAAHLAAGNITDPAELAVLDRIRPVADAWGYDCLDVSPTIYRKPFDVDEASRQVRVLWKIWLRAALRRPMVQVRHMACAARMVWNPIVPVRDTVPFDGAWNGLSYVSPNEFGFVEASKSPSTAIALSRFYNSFKNAPINQPAWLLYVMLAMGFLVWRRTGRRREWLVLVPVIAQSFFIAISNHDQQVRYQLPLFYVFPFLMLAYQNAMAPSSDRIESASPTRKDAGR